MSDETYFQAWVNPLAFLEVDEPWASHIEGNPNPEAVIKYLCTPGLDVTLEGLISRYREISNEPQRLSMAPAEKNILEKLIWPLRHSKASYMVGNYLGTIALCGMVAEMVAILFFEIADIVLNGKPLDEQSQRRMFGSAFEKLGQERRVNILLGFGQIDEETKNCFDIVRNGRRRYLHFYYQDHSSISNDAIRVFNATATLVVKLIGQDIQEGKVALNPKMLKYLHEKGIVETSAIG